MVEENRVKMTVYDVKREVIAEWKKLAQFANYAVS